MYHCHCARAHVRTPFRFYKSFAAADSRAVLDRLAVIEAGQ